MTELDTAKKVENPRISLWKRLLVNLLGAVFACLITFIVGLGSEPPEIFLYFIFLSSLFLGLILPHIGYRHRSDWILYTSSTMIAWLVVLGIITPILTKQYYLAVASNTVPAYSDAELVDVQYLSGQGNGISVNYKYQTKTPEDGYKKMHDMYKDVFAKKGYRVDEEEIGSYIIFQKQNDSSSRIFLGASDQNPNEINVNIHF
ncbi:MAG: hypothetical protein O3A36_03470 [bacterium]|nr:hypothetical protein [bacterium]